MHQQRSSVTKYLLLPLAAVLLSSCVSSGVLEDAAKNSNVTSWVRADDPQSKLAEREHPIVLAKYGGEYQNLEVEKLVALIVGKLVSVSEDKARVYKITLLNSPKVNAFALPGGYLYVTRGLLALANDTGELAGVIAHEMAHVSANHAIQRNQKLSSSEVGSEVVSEVLGTSVAGRIALAANQLRLSDFSKDQELQADAIGIRMLGLAGYDAHSAARFLQIMQRYQASQSSSDDRLGDTAFLSSHPTTPLRVELAIKHARFFGAPGLGEADRERYMRGIDGMLYGDSAEEGFVRGDQFSHLGLGVAFNGPAGSKVENQATSVVINSPGEIATRFDIANLSERKSLVEYLKSGWVNGLDELSVIDASLNGMESAIAKAKGGEWEFVVRVIRLDRQVYRFITAGPVGSSAAIDSMSNKITGTFRKLSDGEKAKMQPLKIKVVRVQADDTLASLAAQMKGTSNGLRLFSILNGLSAGELPKTGIQVKLVSDGS